MPWGGNFYDECISEHDPAFADVYYKNNIGQRATLLNLYMAYGGTNWGNLAAPVVYTSYDYSAPLRETREVQLKFAQTKLIALFARVSKELLYTEMESNGTGNLVSSTAVQCWVLHNPDTDARFYTLLHSTSSTREVTEFSVNLQTSVGIINVPNVQLNGRQSKIAISDYHLGKETLLYSTADILTHGAFDSGEVMVLYLEAGQVGEFAFHGNMTIERHNTEDVAVTHVPGNGTVVGYTKITYTQTPGTTVLRLSSGVLVYLPDIPSAWTFFAPPTVSDPNVAANEHVFVIGPYLVRNVTLTAKSVTLIGDNSNATTIEVYTGSPLVDTIVWNHVKLPTNTTAHGSLIASIPGTADRSVHIPVLSDWKVANSLPEKARDYDDSAWIVCNKTTTLSQVKPINLPVLFSSDYGYYVGQKIYRGYFHGRTAKSANITAQGGLASGWSAWLNGNLVGGSPGNASRTSTSAVLDLSSSVLYDTNNVLTIVTDYTGHDETSTGPTGAENPRGLLGVVLTSNGTSQVFTTWKIQGNAGGNTNIDPVRGPLNEGGIHGERVGWHLPGYATTGPQWSDGSPSQGLDTSGISWYITTFDLNLDADLDVPIGLELSAPAGTIASVQIYVNGYQYGKFIPHIGPQTRFPLQPGVLNVQGTNTLALSVWAETDAGARLDKVELFAYGVYQTGFDFARDSSHLRPGWTTDRLKFG